jgi:hypothetical protein
MERFFLLLMNHNWYAVITAKILLDKSLSSTQKLLIALISNLTNERGYCFASNAYLGECLDISEKSISNIISDLVERKYLGRVIKLNEKNQVEYRALLITDTPPPINMDTPPEKYVPPPPINMEYNNKEEYNINKAEPVLKEILTLNEVEIGATIQYCDLTFQRKYNPLRINELWSGFLIQHTDKYYSSKSQKLQHFRNWIKGQPFDKPKNGFQVEKPRQRFKFT